MRPVLDQMPPDPAAAGSWAIAWATLYTAPLALVVVLVQGILAAR